MARHHDSGRGRPRLHLALLPVLAALATGCARLPEPDLPREVTAPGQGWSESQRRWFYHASQGTMLMPAAWFMALEQPVLSWSGAPRFAATEYLARYGFLPDPASPENPNGLPVGFALDDRGGFAPPGTPPETVVGLTCAACHTGQIQRNGRGIRIEGGPAMTDIGAFQKDLGKALLLTHQSEPRFDRFAGRVLEGRDTPQAREALKARLGEVVGAGLLEQFEAVRAHVYPIEEGFGRLDALGRGGNFVFATLTGDSGNLVPASGPVSYPALWDAPWFDWVQYNGAILQPMGRNVAEAMGVRSVTILKGGPETLYDSTVRLDTIHAMERQLAGPAPGQGLRPPRWPEDLLGPIDRAMAERGAAHVARLCAGCHEGRPETAWTPPDAQGRRHRRINMVALERIGTDPASAMNFVNRTGRLAPDQAPIPAAEALRRVTDQVIQRWYARYNVPPAQQAEMNGYLPNEWRALAAYRARPFDGIWATAPYLHNGSVPSLYLMLVPDSERSTSFYVGRREFDPVEVGFVRTAFAGGFAFDTGIAGNSNRGHEFRDAPSGTPGVIGPTLTETERREIVEYLKTR